MEDHKEIRKSFAAAVVSAQFSLSIVGNNLFSNFSPFSFLISQITHLHLCSCSQTFNTSSPILTPTWYLVTSGTQNMKANHKRTSTSSHHHIFQCQCLYTLLSLLFLEINSPCSKRRPVPSHEHQIPTLWLFTGKSPQELSKLTVSNFSSPFFLS